MVKFTGGMNSGWNPYQTSDGDFPVALCCCALCANSMKGISSTQLSCWKLQNTRRYCSNSWLTCSVSPLVCGWNAVDMVDLTPSFSQTSCMTLNVNWGPLSEITWCGSPVLLQISSIYNLDVSSAVIVLLQGVTMMALLRQSITTNRELNPCDTRRSVMKSMVMTPQMSMGT